jgi:hypothetical protein
MSTAQAASPSRRSSLVWPIAGIVVAVLLVVVGYAITSRKRAETLPVSYGKRRGTENVRSVNGTAILAELFRQAGHRVSSFSRLSPKLEDADVLVWISDDFAPPTKEQREWLEDWLALGYGRTIIFIGRDYDAAVAYWTKVAATAPADEKEEIQRQLARAKANYDSARAKMPTEAYAHWFTARREGKLRDIRTLEGPWAEGVDSSKVDISLAGRLQPPVQADLSQDDPPLPAKVEVLLQSEADVLAFRVQDEFWAEGQVVVLANGAWVLNYPLINREHRKLAARLVNEIGEAPQKVVFIESGADGPKILDKEPKGDSSPLAFLNVWPLNAIVLHLTILGIIVCLARWPQFGRPRDLPAEPAADFGKHVTALGELLARTGDRNYAEQRLSHYRTLAKRESGKSHLKTRK